VSLLGVIGRLKTGTYTVTRTPAGTYAAGRYSAGSPTTFTITAVVEPFGGREIKVLPEGQFAEDVRVLYTATELLTMSPTDVPDSVAIGGETYSVFKINGPWIMPRSTHYEVYVARQRVP
jgi:hypothetical protein